MSYKIILVYVDDSHHAPERIRLAAELAVRHEAHLAGLAVTGISPYRYGDGMGAIIGMLDTLRERARQSLDRFDEIARRTGVHSYERRLSEDDAQDALVLHARYADLVVLTQMDINERDNTDITGLPEYVVLNACRPVLTIPCTGKFTTVGRQILLAWDGSVEASHAVANALPLLRRADKVMLAVCNPVQRDGMHGEQAGADVALYLARHGVAVELQQASPAYDVGHALLSLASDQQADLLVMGAYGHARWRELLLGGVTSTILNTMLLPVLMAH